MRNIILYLIIIYIIYIIYYTYYIETFENNIKYYQLTLTDNKENQYVTVSFSQFSDVIKIYILQHGLIDLSLINIEDIISNIKLEHLFIPLNDVIFAININDIFNTNIIKNTSLIGFTKMLKPYYVINSQDTNKFFNKPIANGDLFMYQANTVNNILTITNIDKNSPDADFKHVNITNDKQLNNLFIKLDKYDIEIIDKNNEETNINIYMINLTNTNYNISYQLTSLN